MTQGGGGIRRVLITGASGYLGRHLARRAAARAEVVAVCGRHLERVTAGEAVALDVTDAARVLALVDRYRPDAIIHAAAANPGTAEATMAAINIDGTRHVAQAAAAVGARLVHVSTDVVFDGRSAPYAESAPLAPLTEYGRSKAAAEAAVAAAHPAAAIVRTSLIYGLDEIDRSTAGFIERLEGDGHIDLWTDVIRQPIEADLLADVLLALAFDRPAIAGPIHVAGAQPVNRYDFGRRLLAYWGVPDRTLARVRAARAADLPMATAVPLDLRLDLGLARSVLDVDWATLDEVFEGWG